MGVGRKRVQRPDSRTCALAQLGHQPRGHSQGPWSTPRLRRLPQSCPRALGRPVLGDKANREWRKAGRRNRILRAENGCAGIPGPRNSLLQLNPWSLRRRLWLCASLSAFRRSRGCYFLEGLFPRPPPDGFPVVLGPLGGLPPPLFPPFPLPPLISGLLFILFSLPAFCFPKVSAPQCRGGILS